MASIQPKIEVLPHGYGDPSFDHGVRNGIEFSQTGDIEYRQPTAQLLVSFVLSYNS